MKKISISFLVALFCLGIIGTCAAGNYQVIYEHTHIGGVDLDCFKSIPVYVFTKGAKSRFLENEVALPLGQYVVGKKEKMINVTNLPVINLFKIGLAIYEIKGEHKVVRITRAVISSSATCYIFDYN